MAHRTVFRYGGLSDNACMMLQHPIGVPIVRAEYLAELRIAMRAAGIKIQTSADLVGKSPVIILQDHICRQPRENVQIRGESSSLRSHIRFVHVSIKPFFILRGNIRRRQRRIAGYILFNFLLYPPISIRHIFFSFSVNILSPPCFDLLCLLAFLTASIVMHVQLQCKYLMRFRMTKKQAVCLLKLLLSFIVFYIRIRSGGCR